MFEAQNRNFSKQFLNFYFCSIFLGGCFHVEETVFHDIVDEGDIGNEIDSDINDATFCGVNEYVNNHVCRSCVAGTTNVAGDNASGSNTTCDATFCGDSVIEGIEECDDGNTDNNDECANDCTENEITDTCNGATFCDSSSDCIDDGENFRCIENCCQQQELFESCEGAASNGSDLDFAGECDGTIARWCENDNTVGFNDCAQTGQECGYISEDFGFYCLVEVGGVCEGGNCGGEESGCSDGICVENIGSCMDGTEEAPYVPFCDGDLAFISCANTQPIAMQCDVDYCQDGACLLDEGDECYNPNVDLGICFGEDSGCVIDGFDDESGEVDSSACMIDLGTCEISTGDDDFEMYCLDDILIVNCEQTHPLGIDCDTSLSGICENASCQQPEDSNCNDAIFSCAAGLICEGYVPNENFGKCVVDSNATELCGVNEYVSNHACHSCASGMFNDAGDDASGSNTACDATLCGANEYVSNHVCHSCAAGMFNETGDDASGDNTACAPEGFVWIPAGSFMMGSPDGEGYDREKPQHQVTITHSFYAQIHEVTQGEWLALMGNNPSYFSSSGDEANCGSNCPVERVNWYEALAYANALSVSENLQECYALSGCARTAGNDMECTGVSWDSDCLGYRLPTEAEWEYMIRAGTTTEYYNGDDSNQLGDIAWYGEDGESGSTHQVAQLEANSWGLYDMSGNVREWCWDWYEANYGSSPVTDPTGPSTGSAFVIRGGSWRSSASYVRSAYRNDSVPGHRYSSLGFRLVSSAPQALGMLFSPLLFVLTFQLVENTWRVFLFCVT